MALSRGRSKGASHASPSGNSGASVNHADAQQNDAAARYSRDAYGSGQGATLPPVSEGGFQAAWSPDDQQTGKHRHGRRKHQAAHVAAPAAGQSQYSRNNPDYAKRRKGHKGRNIAIAVVVAAVVVFAGFQVARALYIDQINKQLQGNKSADEIAQIDDALTGSTDKEFKEPFYVMLIGSDERVGDESMGARSDTNIVVRIDAVNKKLTMVSIPRDTMVDLDGYGTQKFNAAYEFGGAAATIREASQLCNVDIAHYASINFDGLTDLVDAVGGVDVQVDERIDDPDAGDVVIEEGEQHLDGKAALVFARSRAYVDGDYTRVANQRKLISAIIDKVMTLPATEMLDVISAASKCVTTDMDVSSVQALAQQLRKGDSKPTIYSATIPSTTATVDGVSYVIADTKGVEEMMKLVDAGEDPSTVGLSDAIDQEVAEMVGGSYSNGGGQDSGGNGYGYDNGSGYSGASKGNGYDGGYYDNSGYSAGGGGYSANSDYSYGGGYSNGYSAEPAAEPSAPAGGAAEGGATAQDGGAAAAAPVQGGAQ